MDTAKQTHVFDINPKHRTEPPLLPSLVIRFGREREQRRSSFLNISCYVSKNESG